MNTTQQHIQTLREIQSISERLNSLKDDTNIFKDFILPRAKRVLAAKQLNQLGYKETIDDVEDWSISETEIGIQDNDGFNNITHYFDIKYFLDNGEEIEALEKEQQKIKDLEAERTKTEKETSEYKSYLRLKEKFEGPAVVGR
jgi:hypothetical protein